MTVKIRTNNHARPLLDAWELTGEERAEFDYATDESQWFRYKGILYCLDDFPAWGNHWTGPKPEWAKEWDAFSADGFFSGIVIRISDEQGYADCHPDPETSTGIYAYNYDTNTFGEYVVAGLAMS